MVFNKGAVTNSDAKPTALRDSTVNDVMSNHLSPAAYLYQHLPGTNKQVVEDETGQVTPAADALTTNGAWDEAKIRAVESRTNSKLRRDKDFGF
jgi:hypothetical protein